MEELENRFLEDSQMRQILLLKYLRGLSWRQVAMGIGGNNTEDGVRKRAERFLREAETNAARMGDRAAARAAALSSYGTLCLGFT